MPGVSASVVTSQDEGVAMFITSIKKFFGIFRGGSTRFEIGMGITLGMTIGMLPGFSLLHIYIAFAVLLTSVPLAPFLLTYLVSKLISYPLTYVTYAIGKGLLGVGFIAGIVKFFVNAPVAAWLDLDRYCALGGITLGVVLGIVLSILLNRAVRSFRRRMTTLKADSEKYEHFVRNPLVKVFAWIFFGKGPKGSFADTIEKKTRYIRVSRVIVAVFFLVIVFAVQFIFAGPIARAVLISQLEQANGATVDIAAVDLRLFNGRCNIKGIQLCDPDHLDRNLVSMGDMRIDFGVGDLLRKRFVIDEINIFDAATDSARTENGKKLREDMPLPEAAPPKTIYDYLDRGQQWKKKIELWCRICQQYKPEPGVAPMPEEIMLMGYRNLRASYLVEKSPRLVIKKIAVGGLPLKIGGTEKKLDLLVTGFSTDTRLTGENPTLTFSTQDKSLNGSLMLSLMDAKDLDFANPADPRRIDFIASVYNSDGTPDVIHAYLIFNLGNLKEYKGGFEFSSVELADFAGKDSKLTGNMACKVDFRGVGADYSTLQGTGVLDIVNGNLLALPLIFSLNQLMKIDLPAKQVVNKSRATFNVKDKALNFDSLTFSSQATNFIGSGKIGFDEHMDMIIFSDTALRGVPLIGDILSRFKRELYAVRITGTFAKPESAPAAVSDITSIPEEIHKLLGGG